MKLEYAIVSLAIAIAFCGLWIGNALKENHQVQVPQTEQSTISSSDTLSLKEAAEYLHLSEANVKKIIIQEEQTLKQRKQFWGMMFPYIKVFDTYVFSKTELDKWLQEASENRTQYSYQGMQ